MKKIKIFATFVITLLFCGCGVGNYSHTSGIADESYINVVSVKPQNVIVMIDTTSYEVESVKQSWYKSKRKIKKIVKERISISTGSHKVTVTENGKVVFDKTIFVSAGETKMIQI